MHFFFQSQKYSIERTFNSVIRNVLKIKQKNNNPHMTWRFPSVSSPWCGQTLVLWRSRVWKCSGLIHNTSWPSSPNQETAAKLTQGNMYSDIKILEWFAKHHPPFVFKATGNYRFEEMSQVQFRYRQLEGSVATSTSHLSVEPWHTLTQPAEDKTTEKGHIFGLDMSNFT